MIPPILKAPERIIGPNGRPHFGSFDDAVAVMNHADFDLRTPMGYRASRFRHWAGYKQFEYFGIISDSLIFGCALANLRLGGILFCYAYIPATGEVQEYRFLRPLARGLGNTASVIAGQTRFDSGQCRAKMTYEANPRRKALRLQVKNGLQADLVFDESAAVFEPMSICTQIGRNGWVYAHKVAGVPAYGHISGSFGQVNLRDVDAYAHHDFSAGYMRRETFWNWACLSGRLEDGRSIGLNLSCGVNETSYSENCIWLDGRCIATGLAQFHYDQDNPMTPWVVTAGNEHVRLRFVPEGAHREQFNTGIMASNFKQIFGRFNGEIRTDDGETLPIVNQYGFVEDQYAKW